MSERLRNALIGVGAIVAIGVCGWLLALYLGGTFRAGYPVKAVFAEAGQLLRNGSDVKLRGVIVGVVEGIEVRESGRAVVSMRITTDVELPRNVGAAIRAKTLFGEKFVDVEFPEQPSEEELRDGDVIPLERTIAPFEVEAILEKALPLLQAIDPENLSAALRSLVEGFGGNEEALRRATVQGRTVLEGTRGTLPELEDNIVHLRNFGGTLDEVDEDLLRSLDALERAGRTLRSNEALLDETLGDLEPIATDLADVLTERRQDLIDLAELGAPVLEAVAEKAPELPDLVNTLDGFLALWIADLTVPGTEQPSGMWRITVTNEPTESHPYGPGDPAPAPRGSTVRLDLLGRIAAAGGPEATSDVGGVLLAPVPDEGLDGILRRLTGTVTP